MNVNDDLLGKTITGVIAHRNRDAGLREIWVLQFADGSHIEFVSPGGRKSLRNAASQGGRPRPSRATSNASYESAGQATRLTDSRFLRYQREGADCTQLTLNVA